MKPKMNSVETGNRETTKGRIKSRISIVFVVQLLLVVSCAHMQVESPAAGFLREGTSLFNAGKIDESTVFFRKAYAADPLFAQAYTMLGMVYLEKGDTYRAEMFFRKSLAIDKSNTEILGWIGDIYWSKGDSAGAIEYYEKCPKDDPHYAVLHFRLGMKAFENGRAPAAMVEFKRALTNPDYWGGYYGMGLLAFADDKPPEALEFFHRADMVGADIDVKYWIAKSYRALDREAEAYLYFKQFASNSRLENGLLSEAEGYADELAPSITGPEAHLDSTLVIPFKVESDDELDVGIFDLEGRLVKTLFAGWIIRGDYSLTWHGDNAEGNPVEDGIYIGCVEQKFDIELVPMLLEK